VAGLARLAWETPWLPLQGLQALLVLVADRAAEIGCESPALCDYVPIA